MENRLASGIVVLVLVGTMIHTVSPQKIDMKMPQMPCTDTAMCKNLGLPSNAICVSTFCMCPDEKGIPQNCTQQLLQSTVDAINPAAKYHPCTLDNDCRLTNGFCNTTNKQCACSMGFVLSSTKWECLRNVTTLKSGCEEAKQCVIGNSTCSNSTCQCIDGYHYLNNSCWKRVGFGDNCTVNEECSHVEHSECNEHSACGCSKNAVLNTDGQRCLPVAKDMLSDCTEPAQCSRAFGEAKCEKKKCVCEDNNHFEPSKSRCVPNRGLGESCSGNDECYQGALIDGADRPQRCVDNECTCNENFYADEGICMMSGASSLVSAVFVAALLAQILLFVS